MYRERMLQSPPLCSRMAGHEGVQQRQSYRRLFCQCLYHRRTFSICIPSHIYRSGTLHAQNVELWPRMLAWTHWLSWSNKKNTLKTHSTTALTIVFPLYRIDQCYQRIMNNIFDNVCGRNVPNIQFQLKFWMHHHNQIFYCHYNSIRACTT